MGNAHFSVRIYQINSSMQQLLGGCKLPLLLRGQL
jgi:hypothetical protein